MTIGINNAIVPVSSAAAKMSDEAIKVAQKGLDSFKDWAEERKYYSELSLKEELAGWETLQKKYREGSEERKQIDREVYRVQNELVTATYQYSMNWIEEQKSYNKLTLAEELAAYKRVQSRYAKGQSCGRSSTCKFTSWRKRSATRRNSISLMCSLCRARRTKAARPGGRVRR